jgi:hypothetical protein
VTIFLICQTPDFIFAIIGYADLGVGVEVLQYLDQISAALLAFNSACDFVLYVLFYTKFRNTLKYMICPGASNIPV